MPASSEVSVQLPEGVALHARPAANFVRAAMKFQADIRLSHGDRETDAKSLLGVLGLGAVGGSTVRLGASGADAETALTVLADCLRTLT